MIYEIVDYEGYYEIVKKDLANLSPIVYNRRMANNKETTFENRCIILSDVWMEYRTDPDLEEFVSYNDLGLPLGFLLSEELVTPSQKAKDMIDETFELLLASLGVEDNGYESIDDMMVG